MIIANQNFNAPSLRAYVGPGAYFWEYEDSVDVAKELAELWWEFSLRKNHYVTDNNKALAIIDVALNRPGDEEFLDVNSHQFSNRLRDLLSKFEGKVEIDVYSVIAMAIDDLSVERGSSILLVKTWVKTPPALRGKPLPIVLQAYQVWPCLVVRDGGERLISRISTIQ